MAIPYVNLAAQFAAERDVLMPRLEAVLAGGQWVGGPEVETLEARLAAVTGAGHVVAMASGTDALIYGMKALDIGPGDEVITPPNSFVSSTAAIIHAGATPVFADVLPDQNIDPERVEAAITPRTRAIMAVHLTGRVARMDALRDIARRHGLKLIEDAAQAMGSRYQGSHAGTFGDIGCFSAHPLKNLNAAGDAGFVLTGDAKVAARLRRLRNNGLADRNTVVEWGTVSRLDSLQATILEVRLERLPAVIEARRRNAALYRRLLDAAAVFMPPETESEFNTYHTFVVQVDRRDALQAFLAERGIGTAIHYPVPIHLQPAAAGLGGRAGMMPVAEHQAGRILSLPVHQFLTEAEIAEVADSVNGFFQ